MGAFDLKENLQNYVNERKTFIENQLDNCSNELKHYYLGELDILYQLVSICDLNIEDY